MQILIFVQPRQQGTKKVSSDITAQCVFVLVHFININWKLCCSYLMLTLDQYVDIDYSLVYFHHGLTSSNKPPLSWLWGLYKVVDRRYKKNLKTCFIVHPTSFIRVVYNFFKPIIR